MRATGAPHLVQDNELIDVGCAGKLGLGAGAGADDLVATDLCHLGCPLAGATSNTMDKHPFPGLDEASVGRVCEVVSSKSLHPTQCNSIRSAKKFPDKGNVMLWQNEVGALA